MTTASPANLPANAARDPAGEAPDTQLFAQFFHAAPDAMLAVDGDGCIVLANAQAATLFGWPRDQLLGARVETLIPQRFADRHRQHRGRRSWTVNPANCSGS